LQFSQCPRELEAHRKTLDALRERKPIKIDTFNYYIFVSGFFDLNTVCKRRHESSKSAELGAAPVLGGEHGNLGAS
jgi:hypothetical protein